MYNFLKRWINRHFLSHTAYILSDFSRRFLFYSLVLNFIRKNCENCSLSSRRLSTEARARVMLPYRDGCCSRHFFSVSQLVYMAGWFLNSALLSALKLLVTRLFRVIVVFRMANHSATRFFFLRGNTENVRFLEFDSRTFFFYLLPPSVKTGGNSSLTSCVLFCFYSRTCLLHFASLSVLNRAFSLFQFYQRRKEFKN